MLKKTLSYRTYAWYITAVSTMIVDGVGGGGGGGGGGPCHPKMTVLIKKRNSIQQVGVTHKHSSHIW